MLCENFVLGCVFEEEIIVIIKFEYVVSGEVFCLYFVVGVKVGNEYLLDVLMIILVIVYLVKFLDVVEVVMGMCSGLLFYMVDMMDKEEWVCKVFN